MPLSNKRVFSNNQEVTFHDYLTHKKGVEMMKKIKSVPYCDKLQVLSYNDFMILTKTFSKNSNIIGTDMNTKTTIHDKTTGLIYYEKIQTHLQICNYCRENYVNINMLLNCPAIKNIIYAYQNKFSNIEKNVYQKNVQLDNWCKKCDNFHFPIDEVDCGCSSDEEEFCPEIKIRNKGRGRKPIFCSICNKFIDICLCENRWGRVEAIDRVNHFTTNEPVRNTKSLFINQKNKFSSKKNIF
jgi:hypothetical protein